MNYEAGKVNKPYDCGPCHMTSHTKAHDFKIIRPAVRLDMFNKDPKNVIDNSCSGCHAQWGKDKGGYEAGVAAYRGKFGN